MLWLLQLQLKAKAKKCTLKQVVHSNRSDSLCFTIALSLIVHTFAFIQTRTRTHAQICMYWHLNFTSIVRFVAYEFIRCARASEKTHFFFHSWFNRTMQHVTRRPRLFDCHKDALFIFGSEKFFPQIMVYYYFVRLLVFLSAVFFLPCSAPILWAQWLQ